jgi:DNA-binding NtrC family response regulator
MRATYLGYPATGSEPRIQSSEASAMHNAATVHAIQSRSIAVITGNASAHAEIQKFLGNAFDLRPLDSWAPLAALLAESAVEGVLLDLDTLGMPPVKTLELLANTRRLDQDLVLIAFTRVKDRDLRLKAAQSRIDDLFVAPIDFREVQVVIERALEKRNVEIERRRVSEQISARYSFYDLIGGSEPMRRVYDAILRVCNSETTVVIRGESGTGKELVARSIVKAGARKDKPFVSLNCAALPESLIESELFGHEKGAFTGAYAARAGQIETAHGGTLFLDEIATLGIDLQTKLLRVLEEHTVTRLGGRTSKLVDFRLLTATNENLEQMVKSGRFREDLYYRIHVVPIFIPPLRDRRGDIALLADHFLRLYCATNRIPLKRIDAETMEILEEYQWTGNVRELENVIQRVVLMSEGQVITPRDLPQQLVYTSTAHREMLLIPEGGIDFEDEMARIETAYLEAALRRSAGKKVTAAALLNLKPQQMKYLCRKYKIQVE